MYSLERALAVLEGKFRAHPSMERHTCLGNGVVVNGGRDGEVSAGDGAMGVTRWERRPFIGEGIRSGWKATLQRTVYN